MGGEGSIMHMITSLKNNSRRRKNHIPFSKNRLSVTEKEKPIYDFPEATPKLLDKIKSDIIKQQKRQHIINVIVLLIAIVVTIYIIT